jgi:hypothetical protein
MSSCKCSKVGDIEQLLRTETLLACLVRCSIPISVGKQAILTEIFGRFAHILQAVGYMKPGPLPSTPFKIHHSISYNHSTLCRLNQSNRR